MPKLEEKERLNYYEVYLELLQFEKAGENNIQFTSIEFNRFAGEIGYDSMSLKRLLKMNDILITSLNRPYTYKLTDGTWVFRLSVSRVQQVMWQLFSDGHSITDTTRLKLNQGF